MKRLDFQINDKNPILTPNFLRIIETHIENKSEPLLVRPNQKNRIMYAKRIIHNDKEIIYDLWLDNDWENESDDFFYLTWRKFAEQAGYKTDVSDFELAKDLMQFYEREMHLQGETEEGKLAEAIAALDQPADEGFLFDEWKKWGSPQGRAYHELESLTSRTDPKMDRSIGTLTFIDSPSLGYYRCSVQVEGDLALSLLQVWLNELNTGIEIEISSVE